MNGLDEVGNTQKNEDGNKTTFADMSMRRLFRRAKLGNLSRMETVSVRTDQINMRFSEECIERETRQFKLGS